MHRRCFDSINLMYTIYLYTSNFIALQDTHLGNEAFPEYTHARTVAQVQTAS